MYVVQETVCLLNSVKNILCGVSSQSRFHSKNIDLGFSKHKESMSVVPKTVWAKLCKEQISGTAVWFLFKVGFIQRTQISAFLNIKRVCLLFPKLSAKHCKENII